MLLLMIYRFFFCHFAPNFVNFDPWVWHKKRANVFSSFPGRDLGLSYDPLKFSKGKKVFMATPSAPFDGIP